MLRKKMCVEKCIIIYEKYFTKCLWDSLVDPAKRLFHYFVYMGGNCLDCKSCRTSSTCGDAVRQCGKLHKA